MVLENSTTLKKLGINVKPATKNVAMPFKVIKKNEVFYCAKIYEFRDIFLVELGTLHTHSEIQLKKQLKRIYNCDYLMERTFDNFCKWYEKIARKLSPIEKREIKKRFRL